MNRRVDGSIPLHLGTPCICRRSDVHYAISPHFPSTMEAMGDGRSSSTDWNSRAGSKDRGISYCFTVAEGQKYSIFHYLDTIEGVTLVTECESRR